MHEKECVFGVSYMVIPWGLWFICTWLQGGESETQCAFDDYTAMLDSHRSDSVTEVQE